MSRSATAVRQVIKAYDVALAARPGWTSRVSYVIGKDGKIIYVHNNPNFAEHMKGTLATVQAMKK